MKIVKSKTKGKFSSTNLLLSDEEKRAKGSVGWSSFLREKVLLEPQVLYSDIIRFL